MAAAYLFHICSSHAFLEGNERAAAMSALVFLDVNGVTKLQPPADLEAIPLRVPDAPLDQEARTGWRP